jgi:hypothetical protein
MLFLPECLGFMGENAEQTLKEMADPPPIIVMEDVKKDKDDHIFLTNNSESWKKMWHFLGACKKIDSS